MEKEEDKVYDNRFEFNLGQGNRKTRIRPGSDEAATPHQKQYPSTHAASQVAQELPNADHKAWLRDLFRPETTDEAITRTDREWIRYFGPADNPNSLEFGLQWAARRLQEGSKWRKSRRIF